MVLKALRFFESGGFFALPFWRERLGLAGNALAGGSTGWWCGPFSLGPVALEMPRSACDRGAGSLGAVARLLPATADGFAPSSRLVRAGFGLGVDGGEGVGVGAEDALGDAQDVGGGDLGDLAGVGLGVVGA